MAGLHRYQFRGCTRLGLASRCHPDDLPKLMETWQEMVAAGKAGEFEKRLRRHDGVFRWFLCRIDPLRDESGGRKRSDADGAGVFAPDELLFLTFDRVPNPSISNSLGLKNSGGGGGGGAITCFVVRRASLRL
jgi:PAS domain-containing protein